ncbi:hypothetical protein [Pseudogemmobacter sonorensis]|uniref:hypothetical protein n=1 Tax=Pseudogemmobacter sonorensis TaxID=2989681 RepID=UPI0036B96C7D
MHKNGQMRKNGLMRGWMIGAALMAALAGCNTVAGVGDDVSGGARTVQGWFR